MRNALAPVALFVYNRPYHTRQTVESLQRNVLATESDLYIFSDAAKPGSEERVKEVRNFIKKITGFKSVTIIEREKNYGLANSVISGVSSILDKHEKIIVLEDDLITTSDFLNFMNAALSFYEEKEKIFSVSGYSYPLPSLKKINYSAYFSYRGSSWSWATWRKQWQSIDWQIQDRDTFLHDKELQRRFNKACGPDMSNMLLRQLEGKIDSWAIRFAYNSFKQQKLHVLATRNKINNIGHDDSGTHSPKTTKYNVEMMTGDSYNFPDEPVIDEKIHEELIKFHTKPFLVRLLRKFIPVKK